MLAVLGAVLLVLPVSSTGGDRFDCGPAASTMFRLTQPQPPDRFVPSEPGSDVGLSAFVDCQLSGYKRVVVAVPVTLLGSALLWSRRRQRDRALHASLVS